jgi:DNA-directed RNA polymerase specialized sigma24 family protein
MQHNQYNPFAPMTPDDAGAPIEGYSQKTAQWLRQAPTAAFNRLLDQADPQSAVPIDAETRANRRLCGRWIAVQRLRRGLSVEMIAKRIRVEQNTLLLLECGLATDAELPDAAVEQLARLLVGGIDDIGWLLGVLAIALGRRVPQAEATLRRINDELHAPAQIYQVSQSAPSNLGEHIGAVPTAIDSYELFRRAIVEHSEDAWTEIHTRYRPMLVGWVLHHATYCGDAQQAADIADEAFARAWRALAPERFAAFPTVGALLAYLRLCVLSTLIDQQRAQVNQDRVTRRIQSADLVPAPEQIVETAFDCETLWRTVASLLMTPAERTVLLGSYVFNLPPRAIQAHHPELFPDVAAVYNTKRNLLARLQRSPELRRLREE